MKLFVTRNFPLADENPDQKGVKLLWKSFDSVKSWPIPSCHSWSTQSASNWILLSPMLQKLTKGWEGWKIKRDSWKWKVSKKFHHFHYPRIVCIIKHGAVQKSNLFTLRLRKEKSTAAFQNYKRSSCGKQSLVIQSGRQKFIRKIIHQKWPN